MRALEQFARVNEANQIRIFVDKAGSGWKFWRPNHPAGIVTFSFHVDLVFIDGKLHYVTMLSEVEHWLFAWITLKSETFKKLLKPCHIPFLFMN